MYRPFHLSPGAAATARAVSVASALDLKAALRAIDRAAPLPTLLLVGSAASLTDADAERLRPLFVSGLAPAVERAGGCVIDGGTDAGVMRLMGEACEQIGARFPLVGVIASGRVAHGRADADDVAKLEARHSHFVLVPGAVWGEESPWLVGVAGAVAGGAPAVTLVVGGGSITWKDVEHAVGAGRTVMVVAGSGGVADALAAALSGDDSDARATALARSGRFRIVHAAAGPGVLRDAVFSELSPALATPLAGAKRSPSGARDDVARGPRDPLRDLIGEIDLPPMKRSYLETRWLAQIEWLDGKASTCQRNYYWARRITILGSALLPALITVSNKAGFLQWPVLAVSLVVTISAAWEEFFHNGDRWRHYRHAAEQLKREGWLYLELSGPYASHPDHARAHRSFVSRVEGLLSQDVDAFIAQIASEQERPLRSPGVRATTHDSPVQPA